MTQINRSKTINWHKVFQAAALSAFAIAPLASTRLAQAEPPDHAPAWGYRNKENGTRGNRNHVHSRDCDRDGDGDYDDDYDNDRDYDNDSRNSRTLSGVVTNDRSGNDFTIRADDGSRIRVRAVNGEPNRLNEGDRVRLYGHFQNDVFLANNINITDNRYQNGSNGDYGTFTGVVTDVNRSNRRFTIRTDNLSNNRSLTVYSRSTLSSSLNEGDRVRVYGHVNSRSVTDARVDVLGDSNDRNYDYRNDRNHDYSNSDDPAVDFPGTVIRVNDRDDYLEVRGDNGRTYIVRTGQEDNFNRGDRVRVRGYFKNGSVVATSVTRR